MDTKQLTYILTIAKEQNITHAAEKLYITRSALNYSLLNLEKELGFPLFTRLPGRLIPTYAGELYLEKAQQILNSCHELEHIMQDIADNSSGRISLGVTVGGGQKDLLEVLPQFHQKFPRYTFQLAEGNVHYLEKKLLDGTIDLAWPCFLTDHPLLDHISIRQVPDFRLAIAKSHPLAARYLLDKKREETIDLRLFREEYFILMNRESFVRKITNLYFEHAGFHPAVMIECSRLDIAVHFIRQGMAMGFLPADYSEDLLLMKIEPEQTGNHQVIRFRKGQIFTHAEQYLMQLIQTRYLTLGQDKENPYDAL